MIFVCNLPAGGGEITSVLFIITSASITQIISVGNGVKLNFFVVLFQNLCYSKTQDIEMQPQHLAEI